MKLNLRIEEIVVTGLPLSAADAPRLQAALVKSLAERFAVESLELAAAPRRAAEIPVAARHDPASLGRELANGLYPSSRTAIE